MPSRRAASAAPIHSVTRSPPPPALSGPPSGWCRAIPADVEAAAPLGLRHYNLSISTSDQMIEHKFRGRLDRTAVIAEMTAAVRAAVGTGAETIGVNAEDGSRTDDGFLLEFAIAAREAGAHRVRYWHTIAGD